MAFELKPGNRYLGMWFVSPPTLAWMTEHEAVQPNDVHCIMWREESTGIYHMKYRFRYYASAETWDREDKKSWYSATAPADSDVDKLRDNLRGAMQICADRNGVDLDETLCDCDHQQLMEIMLTKPWCNFKVFPAHYSEEQIEREMERTYQETDSKLERHLRN